MTHCVIIVRADMFTANNLSLKLCINLPSTKCKIYYDDKL